MKNILFVALLFSSQLFAQINLDSKIMEVTVFRSNAELVSVSNGKLPAGTSEVIIENISTYINPSSLQVSIKTSSNVSLLSAVYELDYINSAELNEMQKALKAEQERLNTEIRWAKEQKQIYYDLETVLNENKKLGGANLGLNPQDLVSLLEIYKTKQYEYNQSFLKYEKIEKDLNLELSKVQSQINEQNAKFNTPTGAIRLQVSSLSPSNVEFKCSYIVSNAGWEPIYDLRSEGTNKNVVLNYKANVYQNSGYDWNNVQVSVSTGNPIQNNDRPIMNPLYADFYQAYYGTVDYKTESISQNFAYNQVKLANGNAPEMVMDEIVLEKDGFAYNSDLTTTQFATQFELSLPQSIPSDGKVHLIGLESYDLNSEYIYHAVPKLDAGAFLLAKVSNWGQYNLLPGTANIFFEGAYVGESFIDPNVSSDTLLLSMGRDESIKITRKEVKDYTSTKMVGSNKKEAFAYDIEVKNNKNYAITIEILDQIPVSSNKEIVVELEEQGGAQVNTELGKLEWNLTLAANQSKKVRFAYSVKYPKDKVVTGKK